MVSFSKLSSTTWLGARPGATSSQSGPNTFSSSATVRMSTTFAIDPSRARAPARQCSPARKPVPSPAEGTRMESAFYLLVQRGFVTQTSNAPELRGSLRRPITVYCGCHPPAASLHIGHLVQIMLLANLSRAGQRVIAVVGGGTTMVGDPTGRTEERPMLSVEQIRENQRSEEHTSELQSRQYLVCRLLLEKKKQILSNH